jgi:drug/metabolite transporter (DMT)-like permease
MKTLMLLFVALLSIVLFRRRYEPIQWLAMLLVVFGLCIVGLHTGSTQETEKSEFHLKVGLICMLLGQFCHAFQMILEEYLLKNWSEADPLYMMGWEGSWGLLFTFIFFASAKLYNCPLDASQCVNGHLDDLDMLQE